MRIPIYQVDAFATRAFSGNPAAVCPLTEWLDEDLMQAIAAENNLSETAFFVPASNDGEGTYRLRWFTPASEVDLCGHATLASAYILFDDLEPALGEVTFKTRSGPLGVRKCGGDLLEMDFPVLKPSPVPNAKAHLDRLEAVLGRRPVDLYRASNLLAVYEQEEDVRALRYQSDLKEALIAADAWGLIVTAPAREETEYDFVSRFFAPLKGVPEDPVTGSAHCTLAPYWSEKLGMDRMMGYQASTRGGYVQCVYDAENAPDRVTLAGSCCLYMRGEIRI